MIQVRRHTLVAFVAALLLALPAALDASETPEPAVRPNGAVCHDILDFSARVVDSIAGQLC